MKSNSHEQYTTGHRAAASTTVQCRATATITDNRAASSRQQALRTAINSSPIQLMQQVAQLNCSTCGKAGHNRNNRKFHPLNNASNKTYKNILKVDSEGIRKKHGKLLGKGQYARVFTKKSKLTSAHKGKTNVYIYFDYKALRSTRGIGFANYMLEEIQKKYDNANRLLSSGAETAIIGSAVHEATSSHKFADAQYLKKNGNLTGLPKNASGSTNIRATANLLNPPPVGLLDNHGNPPQQDVDEFVSRNYGGTGSHSSAPVPGRNQGFMERYSNSQAGAVDTSVLAHAKVVNLVGSRISRFKLRRTSSFTKC